MTRTGTMATLAAVALLTACAAEGKREDITPQEDPRTGAEVSSICFTGSINGFRSWDRGDGLILRKGVNDEYLVTVLGICPSIDNAQRVGFDERFGAGCLRRGDDLYVSSRIFPSDGADPFEIDRCKVDRIYEWNDDAEDADAVEEAGATE